jgi:multicomponent Na+:H+ antiporter subunit G
VENDIFTAILLILGTMFLLLAAVGVTRLPDLFSRMQASTKATTLGVGSMLLAVAVHFGEMRTLTRALLAMAFVFLTAPVAAHMIGRAAYFVGVPLWEGTIIDELRNRYDRRTHTLHSPSSISAAKTNDVTATTEDASRGECG